jgi:hypothetical protein
MMWQAAIPIIGQILDKVLPDEKAAADAKIRTLELLQAGEFKEIDAILDLSKGQMEINRVEAGTDLFRGGWRPACGWICAFGLGYNFILRPIAPSLVALMSGKAIDLPPIDNDTLTTLLWGMLGLGGLRTIERIKGRV